MLGFDGREGSQPRTSRRPRNIRLFPKRPPIYFLQTCITLRNCSTIAVVQQSWFDTMLRRGSPQSPPSRWSNCPLLLATHILCTPTLNLRYLPPHHHDNGFQILALHVDRISQRLQVRCDDSPLKEAEEREQASRRIIAYRRNRDTSRLVIWVLQHTH